MYSAVRCRLPECGGFVLQRKDEGFTFFVIIINDLTHHHHRHHHQNHHDDSHQVLTAAGNVGFANRSKVTQRCLHLPPCSRTRCTSAPCAPCAGVLIILPTLWLQVREPGISLQEIDALRLSLLSCLTDITTKSPLL